MASSNPSLLHTTRFIALTFGISWLIVLAIYLLAIPLHSLEFNILTTLLYLPAPGIAALILNYFDKQSILPYINWKGIHWKRVFWLPLVFLCFIVLSFTTVYLLGNMLNVSPVGMLEWSEGSVKYRLAEFSHGTPNYSKPIPLGALWLFLSGVGTTILAGFTINALKSFAEELGWRGYLYEQIRHWGWLKSGAFIGLITGIWYVPLIALGVNFPTQTLAGIGLMILACIIGSILLTLIRVRTQSVIGSSMFSGMFKGCSRLFFVYIVGGTELFSSSVGIAGIVGMLLTTLIFGAIWRNDLAK